MHVFCKLMLSMFFIIDRHDVRREREAVVRSGHMCEGGWGREIEQEQRTGKYSLDIILDQEEQRSEKAGS